MERFIFQRFNFKKKIRESEVMIHSRSQARVKEEGCVRFWQTSIKNSHSNGFETHKKLVGA